MTATPAYPACCEKWGIFEITLSGPDAADSFDRNIVCRFQNDSGSVEVNGFYDGDGTYKVRFMPSAEGEYRFTLRCDFSETAAEGSFTVTAPGPGNHGPVSVSDQYHFRYADGTPHYSVGTTCYVWHLSDLALREKTLETLAASPFNKMRMCVFPKHYDYNLTDPAYFPFAGTPCDISGITSQNFLEYDINFPFYTPGTHLSSWDFHRFDTDYFRNLDACVENLMELGIEADLILFHPYDRWGFSAMTREQDTHYLHYIIARYAAYRNVWWSMANEHDLMKHKTTEDWNYIGNYVMSHDPYGHLRSIHNALKAFDHRAPWITHCSFQRMDAYLTAENTDAWRGKYGKPVIVDEFGYEGNLQHGWGNLTPQEMVRRFWEAAVRGGYGGHSETYIPADPDRRYAEPVWWSHGGVLIGESPARIRFLKEVLEVIPGGYGLKRFDHAWDDLCAVPENEPSDGSGICSYYLLYYSFAAPSFRQFYFDDKTEFEVSVLDTWNMTSETIGVRCGRFEVQLPGRPYMAIRIQAVR